MPLLLSSCHVVRALDARPDQIRTGDEPLLPPLDDLQCSATSRARKRAWPSAASRSDRCRQRAPSPSVSRSPGAWRGSGCSGSRGNSRRAATPSLLAAAPRDRSPGSARSPGWARRASAGAHGYGPNVRGSSALWTPLTRHGVTAAHLRAAGFLFLSRQRGERADEPPQEPRARLAG